MQAAVYKGDGHFEIESRTAVPPGPGQAQVAVSYCGLCGTDMHVFHGKMDRRVGLGRVIGHEMSGTVSAVGEGVDPALVGSSVVVRPLDSCGDCPACNAGQSHICHRLKFLGLDSDGALQGQWNVRADLLHVIPTGVSLAHAALAEPMAVACHDVRRAALLPGEKAVVIGGGPIGVLVALAARQAGAEVRVLEINPARRAIAEKLGLVTLDPAGADPVAAITEWSHGKGADVVFEVSGSAAGVTVMTNLAASRGRIVMVAIHTEPKPVDLFRLFWREIDLLGARVYQPQDFDAALRLLGDRQIDADAIITNIVALDGLEAAFRDLDGDAQALKTLVKVS